MSAREEGKAIQVSDVGIAIAAPGPEGASNYSCERPSPGTPLGAFVRESYAEDCFRFIAALKQRMQAATEPG